MKIETKYSFGDKVHMKLGDKPSGYVTGIFSRPAQQGIAVLYEVTLESGEARNCYEFEMAKTGRPKRVIGLRR